MIWVMAHFLVLSMLLPALCAVLVSRGIDGLSGAELAAFIVLLSAVILRIFWTKYAPLFANRDNSGWVRSPLLWAVVVIVNGRSILWRVEEVRQAEFGGLLFVALLSMGLTILFGLVASRIAGRKR